MQLDVLATWNDAVLFSGRVDSPVRLEDFLPDARGVIARASGEVVVPDGFVRDDDGALVRGDLRVSVSSKSRVALSRSPRLGRAIAIAIASLGAHAGALLISRATPIDLKAESEARMRVIQHLLNAHVSVEADVDDKVEAPTKEGGTGQRAKGEEGAMGNPAAMNEAAASFGMIGLIGTGSGGGGSSVWGTEVSDAEGARGLGIGSGAGFGAGHGSLGHARAIASTNTNGFGDVRAGEWDDNATLREFRRVLAGSSMRGVQPLDVSIRRVLVARDVAGKALASCSIVVADAQGTAVTLTTMSNGRALLFPRAENLVGDSLTASMRCGGNAATETITIGNTDDALVLLDGREPRDSVDSPIDVGFALDTTGSMSEEIEAVKATLRAVASRTQGVRVGLVEYKDRGDPFVTRVFGMTGDLPRFSSLVASLSASGGGDMPEAVNVGVHDALTRLEWNKRAPARLLFVIGDAPPHEFDQGPRYADEARFAAHDGIQVFTIAASGMDAFGQIVFRQLAQFTGGTEMFVLRGGAGPRSVGGGDPMKSCGGTQTAYRSGNLDSLIVSKITLARAALDADPREVRGIGHDAIATCAN